MGVGHRIDEGAIEADSPVGLLIEEVDSDRAIEAGSLN